MKLFSNSGKYSSDPKAKAKAQSRTDASRADITEEPVAVPTLEERSAARKAAAEKAAAHVREEQAFARKAASVREEKPRARRAEPVREERKPARRAPAAQDERAPARRTPVAQEERASARRTSAQDRPVRKAAAPVPAEPRREARPVPAEQVSAAEPQKKQLTPEQKARIKARKKKAQQNRSIFIGAVAIFCTIMIGTFMFFGIRKMKATKNFRELSNIIEEYEKNDISPLPNDDVYTPSTQVDASQSTLETEPQARTIKGKYAELYIRNAEFFGWVEIEGTNINYPVMRSFEDNDEYLQANFDGEYSYSGIPFADIKCSHDSDNILIYAHNMKDGTMFRHLMKYEKESFWKKHPTIMFSDLYEDYEYEVVAAFYDRIYLKTDDCFKFYQFIDAASEADFDYAISQFKEKSLYDTGVDAQYGDKLITLVTCAYNEDNGRFVVVARRK